MNRTVLISGASIAGPALAYWLHRYGFQVTVVERAPAVRPGGQAIDLRGTARTVAERMGIIDDVRAAHTGAHGMATVDSAGRRTSTMGADLLGDSGGAIADLEILRGDLVRILYDRTKGHVEYLFDDTVTALSQDAGGVDVTFQSAPARRFDIVVGADGAYSTVRSLAFGPSGQYVRDMGAYIAIFTSGTRLDLAGWELMHLVPGKHGTGKTAALYPLPQRDATKSMFVFGAEPARYARGDVDAQKRLVANAFQGVGWEVPWMLERMWPAPDFYFDRVCQVVMDRWHTGRVVLLGDAGYCGSPLGGNGSSMALVGAYVLAGELASQADHTAAFLSYGQQLREFVERSQKFARSGKGFLMPGSKLSVWFRNFGVRTLPYLPWKGAILAGIQKTTNLVIPKDYAQSVRT